MRLTNLEREMTKKEKAKEKRLKKKYDDSDMKASMKKQYGDDWETVYYATIRKKAMEKMQTERKSLSTLRNRSSFDAQNRLKDKNKLPTPKVVKPAQLDLFDDEGGQHDRMYKVVHVSKGMMDIKAKTSYEAAKKFAKEKGLKSTAGVDTHLYPLEEAKLDKNFFRNIASMDEPHEEINRLLTADGPEGDVIRREYEITAGENGLHPDDDFEEILDMMVHDFEDMTFENKHPMVAPPVNNPKFKSNMPIAQPNKNSRFKINTDFYKNMQKSFQQQGQEKPWWMREGYTRLPDIDKERYTEMPGLEGPFQTMSGKPIYYDPKEGSYYDRDTDMYLTYAEFKALDDPKPDTGRMKEGHSPHKKGTEKYKKHMAAMHANSVDLNAMRDALKLDESTDANTVVAQYTRACLDLSHNTWGKVCEQIDHVRSFIKEDVDVKNVRLQIRKMHEQESLDRLIQISENVGKLRDIVKNKSAMPVKFSDGTMKVDMTTASIFLQAYDQMKERNQMKIQDMMNTKAGFLKVLDFIYGAMK